MQTIQSIQTVTGPTLSIAVPPEMQGKKVEVVVTALENAAVGEDDIFQAKLAALTREKPKLSPEWERRLAENPDLLKGSELRYEDAFGPACPIEDWEALQ